MSEWIEWGGGECPVPPDTLVRYRLQNGTEAVLRAGTLWWGRVGGSTPPGYSDLVAYKVIEAAPVGGQVPPRRSPTEPAPVGGKLSGDHYYRVTVSEPISPEVTPYVAECADIIEALGMSFNEGEAFKAIWRLAARRQGRGKVGGSAQYDADKVAHYGARVAAQTRREGK